MRPSDDALARLGRSLREIDPSTLQDDPELGPVRWWMGEGGTELFAWGPRGEPPRHLQLVFAKVSLDWSHEDGLKTGAFQASGPATAGGRYDPYYMHLGPHADPDVCRAAAVLLQASAVDASVLSPLLGLLGASAAAPGAPSGAA